MLPHHMFLVVRSNFRLYLFKFRAQNLKSLFFSNYYFLLGITVSQKKNHWNCQAKPTNIYPNSIKENLRPVLRSHLVLFLYSSKNDGCLVSKVLKDVSQHFRITRGDPAIIKQNVSLKRRHLTSARKEREKEQTDTWPWEQCRSSSAKRPITWLSNAVDSIAGRT